jgi:hypothetical protein
MKSNNRYKGIDTFTIKTIRTKARELIRKRHFLAYDQEDIEQELIMHLLTRLPLADITGQQLKAGIIKKLVDEKAAKLIRSAIAQKRGRNCTLCSIDDPIGSSPEGNLYLDIIPENSTFFEAAYFSVDTQAECKIDVDRALQNMPITDGCMPLSELCELLKKMTITEIHEEKGVSRPALYRSISKIRQAFLENNLKIYT